MKARRDRLDRIRDLWAILIDHTMICSNGVMELWQEGFEKAKAEFQLKFGMADATVTSYLTVLYYNGAYRRNDKETEEYQKQCAAHDDPERDLQWFIDNPDPVPCWILNPKFNLPNDVL